MGARPEFFIPSSGAHTKPESFASTGAHAKAESFASTSSINNLSRLRYASEYRPNFLLNTR
jgi:hypothetical protein